MMAAASGERHTKRNRKEKEETSALSKMLGFIS